MKRKLALISTIFVIGLAACGARAGSPSIEYEISQPGYGGGYAEENYAAPLPTMTGDTAPKSDASGISTTTNPTSTERLVIKNADITIVVPDPHAKLDAIAAMADSMGGFVISSNMYQTYTSSGDQVPEGNISIRVPAEKLNAALTQIKADAVDVRSETQTGQDVTAAYVDLQSQLTNLEQAEKDLQDIMDEAKDNPNSTTTSKTQDVLEVYNQIVIVRGQIEQIKGQMKYYEEASAYSLINVYLIAEETVKPIEIGGWKPEGKVRDAAQALIRFLQGFVDFLIYVFILIIPILIVIFGPIALLVWGIIAIVKHNRRKKAKTTK